MHATLLSVVLSVSILVPAPNSIAKSFSFAVIGDTQTRKHIMRRSINSMNKHPRRPAFTVHLGDMDWAGYTYMWQRSMRYISKAKMPWYYTIGNHELYNFIPHSYSTRSKWVYHWYGHGSTFRVFKHRGKTFVILDNATSRVPKGHVAKLRAILKKAPKKSVFVFSHRPLPYPKNFKIRYGPGHRYWHRYSTMSGMGYSGRNKALWRTLKKYQNKILGAFHGHYHAFRKYSLGGIPVYCSGGGGGALETRHDYYHYLVVTVNKNGYAVRVVKV